MKSRLSTLLLAMTIASSSTSHAVIRVGGGKVSSDYSMASTDLDSQFPIPMATQDEGIVLSPLINPTDKIFVDEVLLDSPDIAQYSANELRDLFEYQRGFTAIYHPDACVVGFYKRAQNTHTFVVTWGSGRGMQFIGTDSDRTRQAILRMIRTLKLESGACAWKP